MAASWGLMARGKRTTTDNGDYANHFEEAAPNMAEREDDEVPLLPWLEAVDEDEQPAETSRTAFWVGGGVACALIAALGIYVLQQDSAGPDLASAPPPEATRVPGRDPAAEVVTAPPQHSLRQGPTIQLASHYSTERAERHWQLLLQRHKKLVGLDHAIVTGSVNGKTVYRLRASGAGAFETCERLRNARVGCLQIGH